MSKRNHVWIIEWTSIGTPWYPDKKEHFLHRQPYRNHPGAAAALAEIKKRNKNPDIKFRLQKYIADPTK